MSELTTTISTAIAAFSATNIDDIVILLLFFAQINPNFRPRHIIFGQYLGFTILIIISLPGFFGGLVLPPNWIGLLGLLPLSIGISSLVNWQAKQTEEVVTAIADFEDSNMAIVASLTVANGSDNISVYVPLFANNNLENLLIMIAIFFLLLGIWCYATYQLTHQKIIANFLIHYGNNIVPFVLMGLGAFIVLKSQALSLIKLGASCLCLTILLKNHENAQEVDKN
ncbi:cadmium resistance transporter [Tolypothrix tenuis PCC 7101]|uniref:Cadmium resistance transporter n=1 Tax=Tolypothrix tenuis PCC 7101 TaxID=231146 RepID=A0A1Z4MZG4_9CYAN|nr:cadmium resistance transporter [Aulosira sp. FACHB-113]BAY98886.1 cadmium resistance transporter [Tolypothrix tenuis PCC 7101]BAZ77195.1 cadmium resistance transporter [Aulosira laxa NIES-50]